MWLQLLFLAQAMQPEVKPSESDQRPVMSSADALAALTQIKSSIEWNDKDRAYACKVKEGSGITWLDLIPCAALKKCEKGRKQKPEELVPCFQEQAAALVQQAIQH